MNLFTALPNSEFALLYYRLAYVVGLTPPPPKKKMALRKNHTNLCNQVRRKIVGYQQRLTRSRQEMLFYIWHCFPSFIYSICLFNLEQPLFDGGRVQYFGLIKEPILGYY